MEPALPIAETPHHLPLGGRIPLARGQVAGVPDRLDRLLADRERLTDAALADLDDALGALAATLADRIEAMLDGEPTGETELEAEFQGLKEGEQVKAVVLAAQLDQLLDIIEDSGLASARSKWFTAYGALADTAERSLGALGVPDYSTLLDREASAVLVDALTRRHDDALFGLFQRQSAARVLDALQTQVGLVTNAEIADQIQEAEDLTRPQAISEAETRIAEADRYFHAVAAEQASDDAGTFLFAYGGPSDAKTRPFCRALVGKAFSANEIADLRNGQTASPPFYTGGGYRCRHLWVPVLPAILDDLPYSRGTEADIRAANSAAGARGKKGKAK